MAVSSKAMVEGALCVGLSAALSMFRLFQMPQGGDISLTMLPLLVFALRHGGPAGMTAGFAAGMLRLLIGAYIVHPVQALLDYPLGSAAVGLAGFFPGSIYLGIFVGMLSCLMSYVLSGVIFFSSYAPEGTNVWLYSLIYNGTIIIPELIIDAVAIRLLWPRLKKTDDTR